MKTTKPRKKRVGAFDYTESSGNVFADLGLPHPEEALAKAEIASMIQDIVKERNLSQAQAAKILQISQPKMSLLLRGFLTNFSLERLLRFLNDLGQDVYISVVPSSHKSHGTTMIGESPSCSRIAALGR
jgi:predicted XRE-type DNA-binding protein